MTSDAFAPLDAGERQRTASPGRGAGGRSSDDWRLIWPPPADAPEPDCSSGRYGAPTAVYVYRDQAGRPLMYVARYDPPEGKVFQPFTYRENARGRCAWRWKNLPDNRPLYGLELLAARPDAPVLWVEGEKAAEAGRRLFPGHVVVASNGGAKAVGKTDWRPLQGRRLVIWPDNDAPGRRAMEDVGKLATEAGAISVHVVQVPGSWPEGWDVADPVPGDL